jgi:hypothetical protein
LGPNPTPAQSSADLDHAIATDAHFERGKYPENAIKRLLQNI